MVNWNMDRPLVDGSSGVNSSTNGQQEIYFIDVGWMVNKKHDRPGSW